MYGIDIFEYVKLAELCFYSETGVSVVFIDRVIRDFKHMPLHDKKVVAILANQIKRKQTFGEKYLTERQGKFLARYDLDNSYNITVKVGKKQETRDQMYLYDGKYWDGPSTVAVPETIIKIEKVTYDVG